MKRNLGLKAAIILIILLVFFYGIFGIPKDGLMAGLQKRINLGLDLKGGTHLILQVMANEAVNAETERAVERLKEKLRAGNLPYGEIIKPADAPERIQIKGVPGEQSGAVRQALTEELGDYVIGSEGDSITATLQPGRVRDVKSRAVTQAIETIRSRVDTLGVTEPVIQEHGLGEHQILVQLPGVSDPARVKNIIQSTAMLELKRVFGGPYTDEATARQNLGNPNEQIVMQGNTGREQGWFVVSRASAVSGSDIRDAQLSSDEAGRPSVRFNLTVEAGRRFGNFTAANVGNLLGVILDSKVREAATIQSQINDEGTITGSFTKESAGDLALMLRSGALPASIRYLEDRTVGASLGADSVRQGVTAGLVGLVLVVVFMLIYYKGAGINAVLGLILNVVILLGFLGFSGASLTLPGIAGVILTIGMGVDSNVLIFERIREELRNGKSASAAVDQGFARAWLAIIDTHVTVIVSAFILFIFGSGPVRGFAITLAFGLFANLFTAVFVSRVIFDWILSRKQRGEALSI
jgi:preprotein translocase subunit SecD